jgi:ferrous iron transport protein B
MTLAVRVALVGNPNCGKTALFNGLTGARQKVANYPGVTVEKRVGRLVGPRGQEIEIVDLPGSYSLEAKSPDEAVTRRMVLGEQAGERRPDIVLCVVDAGNLRANLRFVLELKQLGLPMVLALNMMDLARRDGIDIDVERLSRELDMPVIPTVAVRRQGLRELVDHIPDHVLAMGGTAAVTPPAIGPVGPAMLRLRQREARRIADAVILAEGIRHRLTRRIDDVVLHPVAGPVILFGLLFLMFQAVFAWAEAPMSWIDAGIVGLQEAVASTLPEGWLTSLVADGILAGVGSVVVFLPQILILFTFILVLEQTGYMARAAFLMDRLMRAVGLNGRAFIPLLSSFACAVPGIMAARTIADPRDRMTTILIAPLMTCSARLPVYTLIIAACIPNDTVFGGLALQGLVMLALYLAGIVSALAAATLLKKTVTRGRPQPFLMELPKYQLPQPRDLLLGLFERARIFLRRAGTLILSAMVLLWLLASVPPPPPGADGPAIAYSVAGMIGTALHTLVAPIGFTWEMAIALVPGMAAREIAVAALGTVYALSGGEEAVAASLVTTLRGAWPLPTALAFLAWYVFAPQCLSTIAVTRRETNSWRWPLFMVVYLFVLAYLAAGATFWIASALM